MSASFLSEKQSSGVVGEDKERCKETIVILKAKYREEALPATDFSF